MNQPDKVWPLLETQPRSKSAELPDPSPESAGCRRRGAPQAIGRGTGPHDSPGLAPEPGGVQRKGTAAYQHAHALLPKLQDIYRIDADPGLHAAAEWLLRTWKQEAWLNQVNEEWAKDKVKGVGWWVAGRDKDSPPSTRHPPPSTPKWYVNGQGQTMVVIPGPVEFVMGSPPTEAGREIT